MSKLVICAVVAYLLGNISPSIIMSRLKGSDIREHGSGNAGTTNMLRTYG
ncbi:MAG: glycerol-3-phosphate acyltransferase, partial [Firmicutes bacterium]|nr:glycerol-3-phosphate acyltransferase [Bacillota bacterium]